MARIEVVMPQMGESIAEGTIVKWHKKVGDKIKKDETLLEISTDKVDSEIPSPAAGVLAEIVVPEQKTVAVRTVIAYLDTDGGAVAVETPSSTETKTIEVKPVVAAAPPLPAQQTAPATVKPLAAPASGRFYSPLVLNSGEKLSADTVHLLPTTQPPGPSNEIYASGR